MKLKDKTCVVTGASTGIGRGIAELLAREGARIVLASPNAERGRQALEAVRALGEAIYVQTDVARPEQVERLVKAADDEYGSIDVFVANAGVMPRKGGLTLDETPEEEWDRLIGVNLDGVFYGMKYAFPGLIESRGTMIVIGSDASLIGVRNTGAYCASKGAVLQLVRQAAAEMAPHGVRVNAIVPGAIRSDIVKHMERNPDPARKSKRNFIEDQLIQRVGEPEEIATGVLYLATDATFATGSALVLDGGYTAV